MSLAEECWSELIEAGNLEFITGANDPCIEIIQKYLDIASNKDRGVKTHNLKSWPDAFEPMWEGRKRHEYRVNDRDFNEGDELVLQEWEQGEGVYTGRSMRTKVTYMSVGPSWEIPEGYCVMSCSDSYDKQEN